MSLLKKIFLRDQRSSYGINGNGSFHTLRPELQTRFSHGVKYNMKLIIRGERRTGKSALFCRLKGEQFSPNYEPTHEIQVACILWSYKETDEVVKVDVWDVVDKGKPRDLLRNSTLPRYARKLLKNSEIPSSGCLDSTFIDVYKGASGVILVYDLTNRSSFEYVKVELPRIPSSMPVLILGNCRDLNHARTVTQFEVDSLISEITAARTSAATMVEAAQKQNAYDCNIFVERVAPIHCCEASMLNGFGLLYVHRFLNIPFLNLQRDCLLRLLTDNSEAFIRVEVDLGANGSNNELMCSYERFTRWVELAKNPQVSSRSQILPSSTNRLHPQASGPEHRQVQTQSPFAQASSKSSDAVVLEDSHERNAIGANNLSAGEGLKILHASSHQGSCAKENGNFLHKRRKQRSLVAAFQEDIDPSDSCPQTNSIKTINTKHKNASFKPSISEASSSEEEFDTGGATEDDDDDGLNEDDDDDEEQLGPGLGLRFEASRCGAPDGEINNLSGYSAIVPGGSEYDTNVCPLAVPEGRTYLNSTSMANLSASSAASTSSASSSHPHSPALRYNQKSHHAGIMPAIFKQAVTADADVLPSAFNIDVCDSERDAFERFLDDV